MMRWMSSTGGSSPLARGLLSFILQMKMSGGIIPARAGFTSAVTPTPTLTRDHPRSRGVYHIRQLSSTDRRGSSPLARGLLSPCTYQPFPFRIIPARAGFTRSSARDACREPDHPRSRGVYGTPLTGSLTEQGSSPLARGLRVLRFNDVIGSGIIPARAGFTYCSQETDRRDADHPRSRGVYLMAYSA